MTKQETIEKLIQQGELCNKAVKLDYYLENELMDEVSQELVAASGELGMMQDEPSVYSNLPDFKEVDYEKVDKLLKEKEQDSLIFKIVLGLAAFLALLFFITHKNFLNTLAVIGIMAAIYTGFRSSSAKKAYIKAKDKADSDKASYEASVVAFKKSLENYAQEKAKFINSAKEYGVEYRKYFLRVKDIMARCEKTFYDTKEEIAETLEEIDRVGVVSSEYVHFIPTMISMLQSSRADNLKEALNLAIEEDRAERQAEAVRMEEERRTAIMEQQAAEARRHNEQMEREAQMQAKIMKEQADAADRRARQQAYDNKRAQEKEQWAANQQRHRCHKCANYPKCHSYIVNCGAFRAK